MLLSSVRHDDTCKIEYILEKMKNNNDLSKYTLIMLIKYFCSIGGKKTYLFWRENNQYLKENDQSSIPIRYHVRCDSTPSD